MRTASATYPTMVPQIAQLWQADAAPAAPAAAEPTVVVPAGDTTSTGAEPPKDDFADAFASFTTPEAPKVVQPEPKVEGTVEGGLPAVGADGKPLPAAAPATAEAPPANETPEQKAAREAAAPPANETPEQKAAREAAAAQPAPQPQPQPAAAPNNELVDALRRIMDERQPQPAAEAQPAAPAITPYTAEEQTLVDNFMREWPDVAKASELIRQREYQAVTSYIFSEIGPVLRQLAGQTQQVATSTHSQQLAAAIPDYGPELRTKVMSWIEGQPDFLKDAYTAVATTGNVQQVVAMVERYRKETGHAAPAAAAPAAVVVPAQAAPAAPAAPAKPKPAAVAALAPVSGKRAGVPQAGIQADDFDGAFSEFAKLAATG